MTSEIELKKIVVQAIGLVVDHRKSLLKALAVPVSIGIIVDVLGTLGYLPFDTALTWLMLFLQALVYTAIAVITHRIILLGPQAVSTWGLRKWTWRETQFMLYYFAICIFLLLLAATITIVLFLISVQFHFYPLSIHPGNSLSLSEICTFIIIAIPVFVVLTWAFGRLSLVFPSVAVDQKLSLLQSWRITKHYQLAAMSIGSFIWLIGVPEALISLIPYTSLPMTVLSYLSTILGIAALSIFYKEVYRRENEQICIFPIPNFMA